MENLYCCPYCYRAHKFSDSSNNASHLVVYTRPTGDTLNFLAQFFKFSSPYFVKRLLQSEDFYPRVHNFLFTSKRTLQKHLLLHLDQKPKSRSYQRKWLQVHSLDQLALLPRPAEANQNDLFDHFVKKVEDRGRLIPELVYEIRNI